MPGRTRLGAFFPETRTCGGGSFTARGFSEMCAADGFMTRGLTESKRNHCTVFLNFSPQIEGLDFNGVQCILGLTTNTARTNRGGFVCCCRRFLLAKVDVKCQAGKACIDTMACQVSVVRDASLLGAFILKPQPRANRFSSVIFVCIFAVVR